MCYKNHSSRGNPEWGREQLCANGSEAQSTHHAWRSNVWEMTDLKFTPTATQGEEREEREQDRRLSGKRECNWGREKREISSMCEPLTTSWHSSSVVLCLHGCFTIGALWVCLNTSKQPEKQRLGDRRREKEIFLERLRHQLSVSLSLSFIFCLCNIISPLCPAFIARLLHPTLPFFSLCLSLSVSSQMQSWELGAKGRRQTR